MYLKAIELHGFKSFPGKTRIEFEKGMSCVVGPNGSGKSNISDAIRWVLGETRSSRLRSGGKMEDIIFGGSRTKSPMGFASVSLILDNSDHSFDMDSDRVRVTRKYYRGGDSEYYINGTRVRLRDVQELFFDTGLGKNGYSIVGQGKISEIVTSRPEDRREIFEEAAGIAGYRFRKNEAERRLTAAEANITRLSDILSDLSRRVGPLEKESRKAKEFLRLSEKRKTLEVSLWVDRIDRSAGEIRRQQRNLEIYRSDYRELDERLEKREKYSEDRYLEANRLLSESGENTRRRRKREEEISLLTKNAAHARSRRQYAGDRAAEKRQEAGDLLSQGEETESRRRRAEEKLRSLEGRAAETAALTERLEKELRRQNLLIRQSNDEREKISGSINTLNFEAGQLRIRRAAADSRARAAGASLERDRQSLAAAEETAGKLEGQLSDLREFSRLTEKNIKKNNNIKDGLSLKRDTARQRVRESDKALSDCLAKGTSARDKLNILRDMENSLEGYGQSVKAVLQRAKSGGLSGIRGTVSQVISVEKGYETAVEVALGYSAQNIITEDEGSAKRAIEFLRTSKAGRATFLPLDTVQHSNFKEKLPRGAITADKAVKARREYRDIVSHLLGRTVIVEDLDAASSLAKKLEYRYRIVTLDGGTVNPGGSFTGGSVSRTAGVFTRKSEMESLEGEISLLREKYREMSRDKREKDKALARLDRQIAGREADIARLIRDKNGAELEAAGLENSLSACNDNIESLKRNIDAREKTSRENKDIAGEKLALRRQKEEERESLSARLSRLGDAGRENLRIQRELVSKIQAARIDQTGIRGEINLWNQSLSRLSEDLSDRQKKREKAEEEAKQLEASSKKSRDEASRAEAEIEKLRRQIARWERQNREYSARRMEIEAERSRLTAENKALSSQKEELSGKIARLGERISSMEAGYDDIISKLWRDYELTVNNARVLRQPVENRAVMERQLSRVRASIKKLGNVNVVAIDEYKEVKERHDYLSGQLGDLIGSRDRLTKLISSLSGEMKRMFGKGFESIDKSFCRIFSELFGGGSAKLVLTDPDDLLNTGIDIKVSPPGKVIKSLSALSGGEQALVAIAIYFAILDYNPSPFCVLDEIEAALDDVNVARFARYLHRISDKTQFIVITHRRGTMEAADILYGVTMQEDGVSKLLKLDPGNLTPSVIN